LEYKAVVVFPLPRTESFAA